ncbi:guanine nucleotide-binding protein subunit alpha [Allomyces arbusculus]|nr:guanine nucleotide-binding protein subunit alpha [Allomyces arbusculus]
MKRACLMFRSCMADSSAMRSPALPAAPLSVGSSDPDAQARQRSAQLTALLRDDAQSRRTDVKCLLLGAGESGKSTFLKQMQLIHGAGYSAAERNAYRSVIYANVVQSMSVILRALPTLGIGLADPQSCARDAHLVAALANAGNDALGSSDCLPPTIARAVANLWRDAGVQAAFRRASEYQLNDSAEYFFVHLDRLATPGYVPSDQDILRSRVKTTGIAETTFQVKGVTYRMFDVGGQKSERKKWIHCFENVTAILFMVALSEYDQRLIEDDMTNRMTEALNLFGSICNSRWFVDTAIILFLNKIDLFRAKVLTSPIQHAFPDFWSDATTPDALFRDGCAYFVTKFTDLNQSPSKKIYVHFTCATDTEQIRFVMAAVADIVLRRNLAAAGLL